MKKRVVIFRHIACEGPGYFGEFLERRKIPFSLVCIDQNQEIPQDLSDIAGLVFMGGPMSVNDPLAWVAEELVLIQIAHAKGLPLLGHCLGGQLIARALGGKISPGNEPEIGWLPVEIHDNPAARDWFGDIERCLPFHWHGEQFSLPPGATPLLKSRDCENQAFVTGNALGLQCHLEVTGDMVSQWCDAYPEQLTDAGTRTVQTREQMLENISHKEKHLRKVADRVYERWVRLLQD